MNEACSIRANILLFFLFPKIYRHFIPFHHQTIKEQVVNGWNHSSKIFEFLVISIVILRDIDSIKVPSILKLKDSCFKQVPITRNYWGVNWEKILKCFVQILLCLNVLTEKHFLIAFFVLHARFRWIYSLPKIKWNWSYIIEKEFSLVGELSDPSLVVS